MIKSFKSVLYFIGVLSISMFIDSNVELFMTVDNEIDAGSEITVLINISKGDNRSFARFQQELPNGLTVSPLNLSNGNFIFEDNKLKIIWLKLPEADDFSFSYIISVHERLKGNFDLAGTFSYIDENERAMKELSPELITIIPSPDIDPELIVDIADFEEYFITPEVTAVQEIACIRQSPYVTPDNELVVNILVNKGEMGKFAKIEEKIPPGYTAVNTKARGAIFTFKDQTVKYLWMNLPEESNYIISYILIPDQGGTPGTVNIDGYFSYFEDDETQSVNIIEKETDLLSITDEELSTLLATIPVREVEIQTVIAGQETTEEIVTTTVTEAEDQAVVTEPAKYPVTEEELEELYPDKSYILVSGSGVYYRVQIAAGHDLIDIKKYFAKYNITEEIKIEKHDSWRKYSVGSYSTYREARDSRINIWNTTTIDDAFVVAYNNGVRITVQEALMIANQKWYQ